MLNVLLGGMSFLSGTATSFLLLQLFFQTGAEATALQALGSMGVGGLVAGITMWWKRQDDQTHRADMAAVNAQLLALATNRVAADKELAIALNGLTAMVEKFAMLEDIKKFLDKADEPGDHPRRRRTDANTNR